MMSLSNDRPQPEALLANDGKHESFWRRRVVRPIINQLKQGLSPEKAALTIGLGAVLSVFPILGSTTVLCLLAGLVLKLNHPILQVINWLLSGVQLILIPICVRIGEKVLGAKPVPFSIPELIKRFQASPGQFMQDFGMTGLHAILAWTLFAPVLAFGLYMVFLPLLRRLAKREVKSS